MSENKDESLKVVIENKMNKGDVFTKLIMLAVIVVLIITNWTSCEKRKDDKQKYIQNTEAMKKEIKVEANKNGELQSSVAVYEGKVRDLSEYSEDLAEEVKALKRRKPTVITKFETVYKVDTIYISNTVLDTVGLEDDEYKLAWDYKSLDSTRVLEGNSLFEAKVNDGNLSITPGLTTITRDELILDFTVGVAKNKKTKFNEIFVTPKNPNITIRNLEGAVLGRAKLGINLSFNAGYGVYYGNKQFGLGPFVGLSISKPLIKF
tara:strand:+ start:1235 stop:2023 length:789 start_codon:yes stop_codon:yes gene_type:complete